jgi:Fur family ferric uptake transcriptional regulator
MSIENDAGAHRSTFAAVTRNRLRDASLRVTTQRATVLDLLGQYPHSDVKSLEKLVRNHIGSISSQTMYDVLAALVGAGLVRRVGSAGSAARFEIQGSDNHHHVVCRTCGALEDVDCIRGEAPCLLPSVVGGFIVDEADVTFWGTCTSCSTTAVGGAQVPSTTKENH